MSKLAIFYMIGQYGPEEQWKALFNEQMNLLKESGLYENIEFIDIFVKGTSPIPLEEFPDKVNNITYLGELEEDKPSNRKLYRAYNHIQQRMWTFSNANPEYKILFFHSIGVSHTDPDIYRRSKKFRDYMSTFAINYWKDCVRVLDHYDCAGTEYMSYAAFKNQEIWINFPHYQGFYWWANARYIRKLDPCYFYQDVEWQPWLCEMWIGTGNPKAYNFHSTNMNRYFHDLDQIPYDEIIDRTRKHLEELESEAA